jgi:hypothetical protein
VVGQASTPGDLLRLLAVIGPDVIVLDAEVSATAALSARDLAPQAGIVVVWPSAVSSSVADRQVEPARAAFDLPDAVRRAIRLKEARVAVLAPVPMAQEPAQVVHRQARPRPRTPWRAREHAFGLVAASFIIAVAALGLLRTAIGPGITLGDSVEAPSPGPTTSPGGIGGENQEPQEPTNVDPERPEPPGRVVLLANVQRAAQAESFTHEPNNPPNDGNGNGDGDGDGNGDGEEPPPDGHDGGPNGYDNPREHLVGSHRLDTSLNCGHCGDQPPDWQHDGGVGHAVHGADEKPGK